MYRIEMLPAAHGDAIWIEYGDPKRPRRVVIDGGPASSYDRGLRQRILKLPQGSRHIDLFVVTHIDCDHIDGAIILLREAKALGVTFGEVWFNGWDQLPTAEVETYRPIQGEFLAALLGTAIQKERWNTVAGGRAVMVPETGTLPPWDLPDGARVTVLSPGLRQIKRLRARWASALRDFSPGDSAEALRRLDLRSEYRPPPLPPVFGHHTYGVDRSVANASSIAFVLEYEGRTCLLAGDAQPRVVADSLRRLAQTKRPGATEPVRFDAVKLSHHGSAGNISRELVAAIESRVWLVSTDGSIYGHPHRETAVLVSEHAPEPPLFVCNYRRETTTVFADGGARPRWRTGYPGDGAAAGPGGGALIDLIPPARPTRSAKSRAATPRAAKPRPPKRAVPRVRRTS